MSFLIKKIVDHNNLYWAWEKAKNSYKPGDIWFNELEVAAFEANLSNELVSIANDVVSGTYIMQSIIPVAYPKGRNNDGPRTRQTFWVSVRDQVTWLAVVNIIGRYLDAKMPFWSYGNRLYISMFYDEDQLKFGYYRNTTKYTYRKWSQSWPLYRRHINITTKFLTKEGKELKSDLDEQENKLIEINNGLKNHPLKTLYLQDEYWVNSQKDGLFWAGLDFEKFYPTVNLNCIQENILEYLPFDYVSEEFKDFIRSILSFKVDVSGWNNVELQTISLEVKSNNSYPNLPTGLFVAGFLANVALLKVDEKVQEKLENNKNIAHFRYVDDHVILATSFEELLVWIESYKEIVLDSSAGIKFNTDKTEPSALGEYFKALKNDDDLEISSLRNEAESQCKLDPDFPSPLMTQTLSKVSKIAGTPFNLLSSEEEKNMIADVEHLLVTEFPDHELRKDTRVSFAARMLSSLVPQMIIDSTNSYRLHKNICLKNVVINDIDLELSKHESLQLKDLRVKTLEDLNEYKSQLHIEKTRLKKEEDRLSKRTIKLLLKAVKDNHDKVRLWSRLLEFFIKSGYGQPKIIFSELRKLLEYNETNKLSLTFIHSLLLQVISTLLFEIIKILSHPNSSHKKKQRAINFAKNIFDDAVFKYFTDEINDNSKNYEKISLYLFRFTSGTVLHLLNSHYLPEAEKIDINLVQKYRLLNVNEPLDFFEKSAFSYGTWLWWIFTKLPQPKFGQKPLLWSELTATLELKSPIDINVLMLYPSHLSVPDLEKIQKSRVYNDILHEGILYDIYKNFKSRELQHIHFLDQIKKKNKILKQSVTLYKWIEWLKDKGESTIFNEDETILFDPRFGEWTALEIIRQIAEEIKSKKEDIKNIFEKNETQYYKLIHPHNFKIPKKWMYQQDNLTWEKLTILLGGGSNKIKFRRKENLITDERFIPQFSLAAEDENQIMFRALGSLLISLISKNALLPSKWNPIGLQEAWLDLAKIKLTDTTISSYTRTLISACFSKRNIESQFNKSLKFPDFNFDEDTNYDPPPLQIIDDFIKHVEYILKKLKNQQLLVSSQQPRQLTPISLIQLKQKNYQTLIENEEIE